MKKRLFGLALFALILTAFSACGAKIEQAPKAPAYLPMEECPAIFEDWVHEGASLLSTGLYSGGESASFIIADTYPSVKQYYLSLIEEKGFSTEAPRSPASDENFASIKAKSSDGTQSLFLLIAKQDKEVSLSLSIGESGPGSPLSPDSLPEALRPWPGEGAVIESLDHYARLDALSFYSPLPYDSLKEDYEAMLEAQGFQIVRSAKESIIDGEKGWNIDAQKDGGLWQIGIMIMDLPEGSDFSSLPEAQNHFSYLSIELYHADEVS